MFVCLQVQQSDHGQASRSNRKRGAERQGAARPLNKNNVVRLPLLVDSFVHILPHSAVCACMFHAAKKSSSINIYQVCFFRVCGALILLTVIKLIIQLSLEPSLQMFNVVARIILQDEAK